MTALYFRFHISIPKFYKVSSKTINMAQVPGGMKRRVLRWYDYSWSRGRIQGGGDINTALGLLPDKLKTELALHVNLSVLKKVYAYYIKKLSLSFYC